MASNYFLKFDPEIKGEAQQAGYEGQIEILSFSWGVSQAGGFSYGTGGTSSQANLQDLSLSFRHGPASPKLMLNCATGKHLTSVVLTCLRASDKPEKYLEITLTDVVISSYQTGGSGDDMPIESMSLNFAEIKEEYFELKDDGSVVSAGSGKYNQQTKVSA
jgi:type VI secretion system secreted protein Hcp